MNKQTDERLDEILAQAMFGDRFTLAQAQNIAEFKQARTEILKHYISRDEVMGLIGEDVDYDTTDTEPYWSMENNEGANQLRAELRQALTTNEEE